MKRKKIPLYNYRVTSLKNLIFTSTNEFLQLQKFKNTVPNKTIYSVYIYLNPQRIIKFKNKKINNQLEI